MHIQSSDTYEPFGSRPRGVRQIINEIHLERTLCIERPRDTKRKSTCELAIVTVTVDHIDCVPTSVVFTLSSGITSPVAPSIHVSGKSNPGFSSYRKG